MHLEGPGYSFEEIFEFESHLFSAMGTLHTFLRESARDLHLLEINNSVLVNLEFSSSVVSERGGLVELIKPEVNTLTKHGCSPA
jgi:hypothetical protein